MFGGLIDPDWFHPSDTYATDQREEDDTARSRSRDSRARDHGTAAAGTENAERTLTNLNVSTARDGTVGTRSRPQILGQQPRQRSATDNNDESLFAQCSGRGDPPGAAGVGR